MSHEAGRTLTEMLGTIAIMGILSVAGIWAYSVSMDKLRANTLINEAQKRAVVVTGQIGFQGRTDPTLVEFTDNEFGGGTFSRDVFMTGLYQQFGIKIQNVEKSVCQNILNSIGESTPLRRLSKENTPQKAITVCEDFGTYLMIYNSSMSADNMAIPCQSADDCKTACGICQKQEGEQAGICIGECENTCTEQSGCGSNPCMRCDTQTQTCQDRCIEVEYLKSNGKQWIDTGWIPNQDTSVELFFEALAKGSQDYFGTSTSSEGYVYGFYDGGSDTWDNYGDDIKLLQGHIFGEMLLKKEKNNTQLSGAYNATTQHTARNFTAANSMYLFARWKSSGPFRSVKMKCYYFKIWDNETLVRHFVPMLIPQDDDTFKPAMFDKINRQVYYNQGTGNFDYGPIVNTN